MFQSSSHPETIQGKNEIAVYPGSFDPFTLGHLNILERALRVFDRLVIMIGHNYGKKYFLTPEERKESILSFLETREDLVHRVEVDITNELTAHYLSHRNITHLVRGIRLFSDFESEISFSWHNQLLSPHIDTVIFFTHPNYFHISSSSVREIFVFEGDVSNYIPHPILEFLLARKEKLIGTTKKTQG